VILVVVVVIDVDAVVTAAANECVDTNIINFNVKAIRVFTTAYTL
jgi:hypothetical protein